jgi:signal transduction histidine kinase
VALVVGALVFAGVGPLSTSRAPVAFATFPPLAYAAYRYGPRGASLTVAGLAAVAAWGTLHGFGPFAREDPNDSLLFLQSFMAVLSLTGLTLAAADVERRRSADALRAGEERRRRGEVEQRDEFLSIAAHELRTPTTSLQLAAQLAARRLDRARDGESSELIRALETVAAQSAKLSRLVSQLFDNVRIDAGRLRISPETVDVGALVASIADEARTVSGRRDITVTAMPTMAFIDPLRVEQVVRNLIDNAVKYSPRGGAIEVDVAPAGSGARIAVRDHGEGVPPERRAGLFDRYHQAHDRHEPGGLGLGLYVSRQIVEQHAGTIVAEFPDDGGMRVVVTLPGRDEDHASSM